MLPLIRHLDEIKKLRFAHSRCFSEGDFISMPRLDTKIKTLWDNYAIAKEGAYVANVCFTCLKEPKNEFKVEVEGKLPMLFCNAACRLEFGVSLGLT